MSVEMSKKISWYRSILDKIANENKAFEAEQKKRNESNGKRKGKAGKKEATAESSESGAVVQNSK